jgi:hypothetical protein
MRVQHTGDIRNGQRWPFHGVVQISWQAGGETKTIRAKCLDMSDQGARIECQQAIDFRTNVYVQAPSYGLMGNATVRYCRRSGMKHIVGLLFSSVGSQGEEGRKRLVRGQTGAEEPNAS